MNENFFGKYSVFCVFGSVVGCVIVPLIAQVLQQQSMECIILSAIVITLTAARLKKSGNDSQHSKLLISKEIDRKRLSNQYNSGIKKQKSTNTQSSQHHGSNNPSATTANINNCQNEQEYMQQHEHLKIVKVERRNEEKRLKKLKKREERLKKRDEKKKQKELEEKYKALKEKRRKQQKENISRNPNNVYHNNTMNNYEKYFCSDDSSITTAPRKKGLKVLDENYKTSSYNKQFNHTRQRIPRFNTGKASIIPHDQSRQFHLRSSNNRSVAEALTISCSNLSASCSSLSSNSSSGSASPPPPVSCSNTTTAWKQPFQISDSVPEKTHSPNKYNDYRPHKESNTSWLLGSNNATYSQQPDRILKSYTNVRPIRNKSPTYIFDSSSLFCSNQEGTKSSTTSGVEKSNSFGEKQVTHGGGEYSLFGSHQFGNTFIKSPII